MTFVKKFGFSNYDGNYSGMLYRIRSLLVFDMKERIWKQRSVIISYLFLLFMIFIVAMPIIATLSLLKDFWDTSGMIRDDWSWNSYFTDEFPIKPAHILPFFVTTYITFIMTVVFLGIAGGKVLSQDIETKVIQNYFTRISRFEYVIGKFLAVFLSYYLGLMVPFTVLHFWLCSALDSDFFNIANFDLFLRTAIFVAYACLVYTSFCLAVSASSSRRFYATLIFIVFFVGVTVIPYTLYGISNNPAWLLFDIMLDFRTIYMDYIKYTPFGEMGIILMLSGYQNPEYGNISPVDGFFFISGLTGLLIAITLSKTALTEE
ncbi:MAG: hypothetical protein ACTSRU_12105 [Candidatus Hodarchaeales archaeon]